MPVNSRRQEESAVGKGPALARSLRRSGPGDSKEEFV